jgi:radical SAM protein with 4Fe4S-binding SPASM domain
MIENIITENNHSLPNLFPFITFRQEFFGGLVYNPYLSLETVLDPIEALITKMCVDHYQISDAESIIVSRYGLSNDVAKTYIKNTISKLGSSAAIGKHHTPALSKTQAPEMIYFEIDSPPLSAPKDVIWEITHHCNLHCAHCLNASGSHQRDNLDFNQLCKIGEEFANEKVLRVSLSGGEPLTYKRILDLIKILAEKNLRIDIASNGTYLPEEMLTALRDLPIFHIQVSIDGNAAIHDKVRGKQGAFSMATNNLRRLKDEGISTSISTTVTHQNIGLLDYILDHAVKLGCSSFKAIPFVPTGRGLNNLESLQLSPQEHYSMCKWIKEKSDEMKDIISISTDTTFTFLLNGNAGNDTMDGHIGCAAGHDTLCVSADGTVYPCPFLRDFPIGKIPQTSLKEIWMYSPVLEKLRNIQKSNMAEPCNQCDAALRLCGGGCRAMAYLSSGDLLGVDPNCFRITMPQIN